MSIDERLTFSEVLAKVKPAIEQRLEAMFRERVASWGAKAPEVLAVIETAEALTLRGGKRYRAGMLAGAYLGVVGSRDGVSAREVVRALEGADDVSTEARKHAEILLGGGAALELLQSYLLIQDDWMDGDVERRGGPSAHVALALRMKDEKKGASGAMLAGDLVWGLAVEALLRVEAAPERKLAALTLFTRIHEDVVIGQVLDTLSTGFDIEELHTLKTGSYTVRGPLLLGAALAGGGADITEALERFAAPVGVAFQLRDDLIGVFGSEKEAGRPEASDLRSAKQSAVVREGLPGLDAAGKARVDAVWGKVDADAASITAAVAALEATGARARVEARLFALCDQAEGLAKALAFSEEATRVLAEGASALRAVPVGPSRPSTSGARSNGSGATA